MREKRKLSFSDDPDINLGYILMYGGSGDLQIEYTPDPGGPTYVGDACSFKPQLQNIDNPPRKDEAR